jgi:hypothetical protein
MKGSFIRKGLLTVSCLIGWGVSLQAAPVTTVGSASGQAGSTVNLPITFDPQPNGVVSFQFTLTLPPSVSTVSITPGPILTAASKSITSHLNGSNWTLIFFGVNQTTIGAGSLLTAQLRIAPGAALGTFNVPISSVAYSDASANLIPPGTSVGGTITVIPPIPVITSTATATGTVGAAFSYQISGTNNPTAYNAVGLPSGLAVNTATGLISGTPAGAGVSTITLSATNAGGTGTRTWTLTILPAAPAITSSNSAAATAGTFFSYLITATNSPTSYNAMGLPVGLSVNTATGLISGTPTVIGISTVTLSAVNAGGTGTRTLSLTIYSACDVNRNTATDVVDLQLQINQAIGAAACTSDINKDSICNVVDAQRVINAITSGVCVAP